MCGRFTLTVDYPGLRGRYVLDGPEIELSPRYNIAPSQNSVVITADGDCLSADFMKWGFSPPWTLRPGNRAGGGGAAQKPLINARAETVAEKKSFTDAFENRRCLIPADGFYEWKPAAAGKTKTPFRFVLDDESVFSMAGLWTSQKDSSGATYNAFTIITTTANDIMSPIHHRMPVILNPKNEKLWLSGDADPETLMKLLAPYDSAAMKRYEVSPRVNSAANEGPECVAPYSQMDLFSEHE